MLAKHLIQAIKIQQQKAAIPDREYRLLLHNIAGVDSCKSLVQSQVPDIINAIKAFDDTRQGWKSSQINLFRKYTKYMNISLQEARIILASVTKVTHEESPHLKQKDFEKTMAVLEDNLEYQILYNNIQKPDDIDLYYWRSKIPKDGCANSREIHMINSLWETARPLLNVHINDSIHYLIGFCSKVLNYNIISIDKLNELDALKVIEALKIKIQEKGGTLNADNN